MVYVRLVTGRLALGDAPCSSWWGGYGELRVCRHRRRRRRSSADRATAPPQKRHVTRAPRPWPRVGAGPPAAGCWKATVTVTLTLARTNNRRAAGCWRPAARRSRRVSCQWRRFNYIFFGGCVTRPVLRLYQVIWKIPRLVINKL